MAADAHGSEASPMNERFHLDAIVQGIADDLRDLRTGKISVDDARVRAELSKQFMNGVRLFLNAQKILEARAKQIETTRE